MSENTTLYRKIAYAACIVLLLFPLSWLGSPETRRFQGEDDYEGQIIDEGGVLAKLRSEHYLGQANLGQIDPASETMKLATLGLRGVAVNFLWEKATYYKKTEDWTNLTATLEQLARLQPNFITFWQYQSWNLSYNVSVEFDDYRDRYYYVRRGIEFLEKGERYNKDNPKLLWDLGWFLGHKIGRADEKVQYRRLFKADDDFHPADRRPEDRDNWLLSRSWYDRGVDVVNRDPLALGQKSPKVFFSSPALAQIHYAEAIESEGIFGERARRAWADAQEAWEEFGNRSLEHSTGVMLVLSNEAFEKLGREVDRLKSELEALRPGVRAALVEENLEALDPAFKEALATPYELRTPPQLAMVSEVGYRTQPSHQQVARRIAEEAPELEKEALRLASELDRVDSLWQKTDAYRNDSNFDFWYTRTLFEQDADTLLARELMFEAREVPPGNVAEARALYEQGFAAWSRSLERFPLMKDPDLTMGDDVMDFIVLYQRLLNTWNEETLPDDFPLWEIVENFDSEGQFQDQIRARQQRLQTNGPSDPAAAETSPGE